LITQSRPTICGRSTAPWQEAAWIECCERFSRKSLYALRPLGRETHGKISPTKRILLPTKPMNNNLEKLLSFLTRLKAVHISYSLKQIREETIMVLIRVPGQHWEVEFFGDGSIEVEIFESGGEIYDEKKLDELFDKFSD
jgi:hypothetical protein